MTEQRWSVERANVWYEARPWIVGCNFIPSTAINQLEMWQEATFDAATIDRELGWAAALGMNSARVFLHDLLWDADPSGFTQRIDAFLAIAEKHGISPLFVLFDDCWNDGARLGPQPQPVPGVHNSGWLQSPGHSVVADPQTLPRLESYVRGVITAFGSDARVLGWDLYNEVTNGFAPDDGVPPSERAEALAAAQGRRRAAMPDHLRLLTLSVEWARAAKPEQPLTAGLYLPDRDLNTRLVELSDVISFHNYEDEHRLEKLIGRLRRYGRPILCTEYLARARGCNFVEQLPLFERERVACYNWGLVNGKTQTHIAWSGGSDPWFHDILHADGSPYDVAEVAFIRETVLLGRRG